MRTHIQPLPPPENHEKTMATRARNDDLSSLLELWGLEERELSGEALLSISTTSIYGRRREGVSNPLQNATSLSTSGSVPASGVNVSLYQPGKAVKVAQERLGVLLQSTEVSVAVDGEQGEMYVKQVGGEQGEMYVKQVGGEPGEIYVKQGIGIVGNSECEKRHRENKCSGDRVCSRCTLCNEVGANWCTECGTALIEPLSKTTPSCQPDQLTEPFDHSFVETRHQSPQSEALNFDALRRNEPDVHTAIRSNDGSPNTDDKSCNQTPHSSKSVSNSESHTVGMFSRRRKSATTTTTTCTQRHTMRVGSGSSGRRRQSSMHTPVRYSESLQRSSTRHWDTSGVYLWRKPSSLKPPVGSSPLRKPSLVAEVDSVAHSDSIISRQLPSAETHTRYPGPIESITREPSLPVETSTPSFLLCLPTELLLAILSHLSQSELATCMLVCRRVYRIASDPSLWISVVISMRKDVNHDMVLNVSRRRPRCLRIVHSSGKISTQTAQQSFCRMDALQELTIDTCNFGPFTGDQLLISASVHCSQLSSVDVRWTHLSDRAFSVFTESCQRLRKICLENVPQISMKNFQLLMQKHRNRLTHVRLLGKMGFSVRDLMSKCAADGIICSNVTHFFSSHSHVDKKYWEDLKTVFPKLQYMI